MDTDKHGLEDSCGSIPTGLKSFSLRLPKNEATLGACEGRFNSEGVASIVARIKVGFERDATPSALRFFRRLPRVASFFGNPRLSDGTPLAFEARLRPTNRKSVFVRVHSVVQNGSFPGNFIVPTLEFVLFLKIRVSTSLFCPKTS